MLGLVLVVAWIVVAVTVTLPVLGPRSQRRKDERQSQARVVLAHLQAQPVGAGSREALFTTTETLPS